MLKYAKSAKNIQNNSSAYDHKNNSDQHSNPKLLMQTLIK